MYSERIANAWRIRIRGHDKSDPTAANNLPIMLLTDCHNILNKLQTHNKQPATNTKNTKNNLNITLVHAYYKTIFI